MRRRKPSPALIVAALALVVALGGTAIAASHYIITSTSQIKPSVLRELRTGAARAATIFTGAHAVADRIRLVGSATSSTYPTTTSLPLTGGGSFTLYPKELGLVLGGEVTGTGPGSTECESSEHFPGEVKVEVLLDGSPVFSMPGNGPRAVEPGAPWSIALPINRWIFETETAKTHTVTVLVGDECHHKAEKHFTINSVSIDVVGLK